MSYWNPSQLHDGANNARSDDTSWVKSGIASLLNNRRENCTKPPLDLDTRDGWVLHQQIKETWVINYRAAKRMITGCQDYNLSLKDYNALYYRTSFEILVGH